MCGEHGCGKFTLVEKVYHDIGSGTVFCVWDSPSPKLFDALRDSLNYDTRPTGGFFDRLSTFWDTLPLQLGIGTTF